LEKIRISGRRYLDQALAGRKGLILVTPHFGAVEFLPGFLTLLGYPVAIVARFKTQRLRKRCKEKAKGVGATIIDANEPNSFLLALSALRKGRILITQCDEVECWKIDPKRSIPLFGTSFHVDRTLAILQRRSGASVVFGHVRREGERYTAEIEEVCGTDGSAPQRLVEIVLKKLEKLVYTYPDQWYIWKSFHLMKTPAHEETTVEDQTDRNLPIIPPPIAILQPSRFFPQVHAQSCRQASI
jgi:lauroyl/myristoyl acyltransferase